MVLDAPNCVSDFYYNPVDWTPKFGLAVALGGSVHWAQLTHSGARDAYSKRIVYGSCVQSVAWSVSGDHLAAGTCVSGHVSLMDASAAKIKHVIPNPEERGRAVYSMAWNPRNPATLAIGTKAGTVNVFDVRCPAKPRHARIAHHRVCPPGGGSCCGLKYSPDGQQLALGGTDGTIAIYDVARGHEPLYRMVHSKGDAVKALAWSPHVAKTLASGGGTGDRKIRFWKTSGAPTDVAQPTRDPVDTGAQITNLLWSPIDDALISTHGNQHARVIRWEYPTMFRSVIGDRSTASPAHRIIGAVLTHNGTAVATTDVAFKPSRDGVVSVWDAANRRKRLPLSTSRQISRVNPVLR
jgi:WD40 repeat protein